ncbi:MAG: DUF2461 domain-containing protein [Candidatus Neomarinimicrobiota bacterium]
MTDTKSPFTPRLYSFLRELSANNNRQWFNANKERYITDVRNPMLDFIVMMQEPLSKISKYITADPRPVGGSMFRIYRDTRFSRDKSPYKTHAACHFRHSVGEGVHTIGFYLHLDPEENVVGGGIWLPPTPILNLIRQRIDSHREAWGRVVNDPGFRERFVSLDGEQLKRVPRDFDPDHPFADDLRLKSLVVGTSPTIKQVTSPGFIDYVTGVYQAMSPLMAFLAAALELDW